MTDKTAILIEALRILSQARTAAFQGPSAIYSKLLHASAYLELQLRERI